MVRLIDCLDMIIADNWDVKSQAKQTNKQMVQWISHTRLVTRVPRFNLQLFQSVGPDLGPNCLQKLSVDDTRRLRKHGKGLFGRLCT